MIDKKDNVFLKKETLDRVLLINFAVYIVFSMIGFLQRVQNNMQVVRVFYRVYWVCYFIAGVVALINLFCRRYSLRDIIVIGLSSVVVLLTVFFSDDKSNLFLLVFIGAYCLTDFDKMLKYSAVAHLVCLSALVICSLTGIIENAMLDPETRCRECLGFDWPSYSANFLFYAILAWLVWRNVRASFTECGLLFLGTVFIYLKTDTKNAFVLSVLGILAVVLMKVFPSISKYRKLYGAGTLLVTVAMPLSMIFYTIFGNSNSRMFTKLDVFLSGRLNLGRQAYENYGITLFGKKIQWTGGTVENFMVYELEGYDYVDSSFLQILFNYGIVLLILVLAYLIWIEIAAVKRKDTFILAAYTLLVLHTTFEPHLLLFAYHPLILGLAYINRSQIKNDEEKNLIYS